MPPVPVPGIIVGIERLRLSSPDMAPSTPLIILSSPPLCLVEADDIARLLGVDADIPEVTLCPWGPAECERLCALPPPTPSLPPSPSDISDLELKSVLLYPPVPLISEEYPPPGLYLLIKMTFKNHKKIIFYCSMINKTYPIIIPIIKVRFHFVLA